MMHLIRAKNLSIIFLTGLLLFITLPGYSQGRIWNVAHRGFSWYYPENTRMAIEEAIKIGADWCEIDVQITRDGQIVLMHDLTVDRTTNGSGRTDQMQLLNLKALDAGSRSSPRFAGHRIPTLIEILELAGRKIGLILDLKLGDETRVVEYVQRIGEILQVYPEVRALPMLNSPAVSKTFPKYYPQQEYIMSTSNYFELSDAAEAGISIVLRTYGRITPEYMKEAKERGIRVIAATVNEREEMLRMISMGVRGVLTDRPDLLKEVILSR